MSVNKAILIGNLGRDPELRHTKSGMPVCNMSVATTRTYKDKSDQKVEETEWHRVVVWGKQAEHCDKYLEKGRQVYIEGRLQTRQYEANDGVMKHSTEVVADRVQFLGGGGGKTKNAAGQDAYPDTADDIPF